MHQEFDLNSTCLSDLNCHQICTKNAPTYLYIIKSYLNYIYITHAKKAMTFMKSDTLQTTDNYTSYDIKIKCKRMK